MREAHAGKNGGELHAHGGGHGAEHQHGSFKSYVLGFIMSLILTVIPLVIVMNGLLDRKATIVVILVTAILQFAVQLIFFMHLKEENKPRYNLMTLLLGLVIATTIIAGSIWIMTYNQVVH